MDREAHQQVPPEAAAEVRLEGVHRKRARRVEGKDDLTPEQKKLAQFWEGMAGTALPAGIWNRVAIEYIRHKRLSVPGKRERSRC